jgi:uncharacterized protein
MPPVLGSSVLYLIVVLVLIYAIWGLALLFMQSKLLYRPIREVTLTPANVGLVYEPVAFESADGIRLTGWYVPAEQPPNARDRGREPANTPFTVLMCHGNGGNLMHLLDSLELFHSLGLSCLAFDYRGYGTSRGRPTEAGTYLDAQAAYDWLTGTKGIPPEQIILFGRSLGGSIAAHLAGRVRAAGLVIESAFVSFPDVAAGFYPYLPVWLFARFLFRYDTLAYVRKIRCPVMVVHSRDDELVPFASATRLFEAAHEPKRLVEIAGGHNEGFLLSGDAYRQAWLTWQIVLSTPAERS